MPFDKIPLSEMEANVMVEAGAWKSFDEIEDALTLDELLLLCESISKKIKMQFKIAAAAQGVEFDDEDEDEEYSDDSDLPPELLEAERELARKREAVPEHPLEEFADGFGYQQVTN